MKMSDAKDIPLVIAHRGNSSKFPENSLQALESALEVGADMVEVDIHLTKDNHIVVHHDAYLGRSSQGPSGNENATIRSLTLKELRECSLKDANGAVVSPPLAIPTLTEVLELVHQRKGRILIEIKHMALSPISALSGGSLYVPYDLTMLTAKLQEEFAKYPDTSDWVTIQAFCGAYLDAIQNHADPILNTIPLLRLRFNFRLWPLIFAVVSLLGALLARIVRLTRGLRAKGNDMNDELSTSPQKRMNGESIAFKATVQQHIRYAKQYDRKYFVWTVNLPKDWIWCYKNGIDGIITDYPEECKALLKSMSRGGPESE